MNPVFGIHVGNSTACLAIFKQDDAKGFVEVVANNAGDRVMPAIVTATEDEYVVGAACKTLMTSRWNTTITCNKLMMNREAPEVATISVRRATMVLKDGEVFYELPLETGVEYKTPMDLASCVYSSLYDMARSAVPGGDEISCVLMVPTYYSEAARFRVRTGAEVAGWAVLQVINEPAASVLGYDLLTDNTPPPPRTLLVCRAGGRSCDASVLHLNYGMISILDNEYLEDLGGELLVHTLTNYLADEFYKKYKLNPRENHRSWMKLSLAAENCLHVLSTIESAKCFVESLCDGVDLSYTMSRARFESIISPFLPKFAAPIHTVLSRLGMNVDSVSMVLLCGGLLKIPRLKKYITDIFQGSGAEVVILPSGINYDEVLACGAARQAGFLALAKMKDSFLPSAAEIPVLQAAVSVRVEGAECEDVEIPAGHPLPAVRELRIRSPSERVKITLQQNIGPGDCRKGELEISRDDLGTKDTLKLTIDSDFHVTVAVPEVSDSTLFRSVKMFQSENLI